MYKVNLRLFEPEKDIRQLYTYMMKPENQMLFSQTAIPVNNLIMFEQWLNDKFHYLYHDFFIIENKEGDAIGFTYSYEFYPNDGHCKFALCLYEESQNRGYGAVAAIKMLDYLFSLYSLNQVYTTVFDYNQNSLSINKKGGFVEVGILPNYKFYGGQYYSLHYLCLERSKFYQKCRQYSKLILKD